MSDRAKRKAEYQAYRAAALAATPFLQADGGITTSVEITAPVAICEDGAYVEAVIWVPRAVMERVK